MDNYDAISLISPLGLYFLFFLVVLGWLCQWSHQPFAWSFKNPAVVDWCRQGSVTLALSSSKCQSAWTISFFTTGVLEIGFGQRHKLAKYNLKPTLGDQQLSGEDRNWRSCDQLTPNNFESSKSAYPSHQQCEQDTMSSKLERVFWRMIMKAIVKELGSIASDFFF